MWWITSANTTLWMVVNESSRYRMVHDNKGDMVDDHREDNMVVESSKYSTVT